MVNTLGRSGKIQKSSEYKQLHKYSKLHPINLTASPFLWVITSSVQWFSISKDWCLRFFQQTRCMMRLFYIIPYMPQFCFLIISINLSFCTVRIADLCDNMSEFRDSWGLLLHKIMIFTSAAAFNLRNLTVHVYSIYAAILNGRQSLAFVNPAIKCFAILFRFSLLKDIQMENKIGQMWLDFSWTKCAKLKIPFTTFYKNITTLNRLPALWQIKYVTYSNLYCFP